MAGKNRWVVDASVGIKFFLPEDYSDQAEALFSLLTGTPPAELFVPDLFYAECANILWKRVRRFGYPGPEALQDIAELGHLAVRPVSTASLMEKALRLSLTWGITAYDACYVTLAEEIKAPLVTADEKLFRRFKARRGLVKWIGDFSSKDLSRGH